MYKNTERIEQQKRKIFYFPAYTTAALISIIRLIEHIANLCLIIKNHTKGYVCNIENFFFIHSIITTATHTHKNSLLLL